MRLLSPSIFTAQTLYSHLPRVPSCLVSHLCSFFMASTSAPPPSSSSSWPPDPIPPYVLYFCFLAFRIFRLTSPIVASVTLVGKPFPLNVMTQSLSRARTCSSISSIIFSPTRPPFSLPRLLERPPSSPSKSSISMPSTIRANAQRFLRRRWSRPPPSPSNSPRYASSLMSEE